MGAGEIPMHDIFNTCVFSIPVKFEIHFLRLKYEIVFGVIIKALDKCKRECDTVSSGTRVLSTEN